MEEGGGIYSPWCQGGKDSIWMGEHTTYSGQLQKGASQGCCTPAGAGGGHLDPITRERIERERKADQGKKGAVVGDGSLVYIIRLLCVILLSVGQ